MIEVAEANREEITRYFAAHDYELLERYRAYDPVNWYSARRDGGVEGESAAP